MNKPYSKRFDVCTPINNSGDSEAPADYWAKCGTGFQNAQSGRVMIYLDTVPVKPNKNGKLVFVLFEKDEKREEAPVAQPS